MFLSFYQCTPPSAIRWLFCSVPLLLCSEMQILLFKPVKKLRFIGSAYLQLL